MQSNINIRFKNMTKMTGTQAADLTNRDHWFRYNMPYQFAKIEHPKYKHCYLPVNRDYKPLGMITKDFIDYHKHIDQAVVFKSDPNVLTGIWYKDNNGCYMYNDDLETRKNYFERYEKLMSKIKFQIGAKS